MRIFWVLCYYRRCERLPPSLRKAELRRTGESYEKKNLQKLAAKEHKERKAINFLFCDLCVLLRQTAVWRTLPAGRRAEQPGRLRSPGHSRNSSRLFPLILGYSRLFPRFQEIKEQWRPSQDESKSVKPNQSDPRKCASMRIEF